MAQLVQPRNSRISVISHFVLVLVLRSSGMARSNYLPLLNVGKPAISFQSFRSVILTSCVVKSLDCIIAAYIIRLSLEDRCPAHNLDSESDAAVKI